MTHDAAPDEAAASRETRADAEHAAALFALDPAALGGIVVRSRAGPVRDIWLSRLRSCLEPAMAVRRIPLGIGDDRLLGGLDLAATLRAARPVFGDGVLGAANGGVIILAMAERIEPSAAGRVAAALDCGHVAVERDGFARRTPSRFGFVALDEGEDDERVSSVLSDRASFLVDLDAVSMNAASNWNFDSAEISAARVLLPFVRAGDEVSEALCKTGAALGISSVRSAILALRAACASAALHGRTVVSEDDAAVAARLVLAPRAQCLPALDNDEQAQTAQDHGAPDDAGEEPRWEDDAEQPAAETPRDGPLEDLVLAAARAAIPAGLLAQLQQGKKKPERAAPAGRFGALKRAGGRGRPAGVRAGAPKAGARLDVIETLRAAAPWQAARKSPRAPERGKAPARGRASRIDIRAEDFRVRRQKERARTATIFVVDASGSSALHRLAEAKGAVELLLADCYVRRDCVALLVFRGAGAELVLPPTRSLARAKRCIAALPGGGGTPLASALDAAAALADSIRHRGDTPVVVLMTDGRANIARDGSQGRARAGEDALSAARAMRASGFASALIDTSPQAHADARALALEMGARYLALPYADSSALSDAVRAATAPPLSARAP